LEALKYHSCAIGSSGVLRRLRDPGLVELKTDPLMDLEDRGRNANQTIEFFVKATAP
jgi:hypothetical protein